MILLRLVVFILLIVKPSEIMFRLPLEDISLSWSFYYANVLLMKGNATSAADVAELRVQNSRIGELLITFSYPGSEPERSKLTVRNHAGFVYEYEYVKRQSVDAFTPTVGTGPHFIIPVNDILGPGEEGGRYQVDFFYSDENEPTQQSVGSIVFIL